MIARAGRNSAPAPVAPDPAVAAAYRVLQLAPTASHGLVEAAYWRLVGRAQASSLEEFAYVRRIDELNRACAAISSLSQVVVHDAQRSHRSRRPDVARSFYAVLHLDPAADAEIVELAARLATEGRPRTRDEEARHAAALAAAATLSNPVLRARYDAENGLMPFASAAAPEAGGVEQPAADPMPDPLPEHATALAIDDAPTTHLEMAGGAPEVDAPRLTDETPARGPAPPPEADGPSPLPAPDPVPVGAARTTPAREGIVARLWSRERNRRAAAAEAENDRLLALRPNGDQPTGAAVWQRLASPPAPDARSQFVSRLVFVAGPYTGSVPIPHAAVDGDEHPAAVALDLPTADGGSVRLQVWLRDGALMLQHVDGPPPTVAGFPLVLPIIVLEDGDEVATDAARLRVELAVNGSRDAG